MMDTLKKCYTSASDSHGWLPNKFITSRFCESFKYDIEINCYQKQVGCNTEEWRFKCVEKSVSYIPWQHSVQNLISICVKSLQDTKAGDCLLGRINTFLVTSVISSPLSQRTRPSDICLICISCSGLNTEGFSYQNLSNIKITYSPSVRVKKVPVKWLIKLCPYSFSQKDPTNFF